MTTTARVVVLPQHSSELKIESIELPEPGAEQVVVKQFASGICHSQLPPTRHRGWRRDAGEAGPLVTSRGEPHVGCAIRERLVAASGADMGHG